MNYNKILLSMVFVSINMCISAMNNIQPDSPKSVADNQLTPKCMRTNVINYSYPMTPDDHCLEDRSAVGLQSRIAFYLDDIKYRKQSIDRQTPDLKLYPVKPVQAPTNLIDICAFLCKKCLGIK